MARSSGDQRQPRRLPDDKVANQTKAFDPASAVASRVAARAASAYPTPALLAHYASIDPALVGRTLDRIDQYTIYRQQFERERHARSERRRDRGQIMAFAIALTGTIGAFVAGYLGVPSLVCVAAIVFCIGGPNAATILARVLDRRQG